MGQKERSAVTNENKCSVCGTSFEAENELMLHILTVHNEDPMDISQSEENSFIDEVMDTDPPSNSNVHVNSTNLEDGLSCRTCGYRNRDKDSLYQHIKNEHTKFKPCTKFAQNSCDLDNECLYYHIKMKPEEYICFKCGMTFIYKANLLKHIKTVHGTIKCKKFLQNQCKFSSNTCIYSHSNVTVNERKQHQQQQKPQQQQQQQQQKQQQQQ